MTHDKRTVAVLGAGTMGSGIATVMARAGHRTILYDINDANLQRGIDTVHGFFDKSVRIGKLDDAAGTAAKQALSGSTDLADLASCEVIVEAVFEDLALKKDTFGHLDDIVSESTLFHTNTSTLSVTGIASGSRRPERVVGTNTVACMQSGVYWGYIGLIEGICARIRAERGRAMTVVGTGGLSTLFAQGTDVLQKIDTDLTIHGLVVIDRLNRE